MKKTIQGIEYDTDRDVEVSQGETSNEAETIFYQLRKTALGQYYILGQRSQFWDGSRWNDWKDNRDVVAAGITTLPDKRTRQLETIRPVSRAEALRWYIENFVSDEFKPEILNALEKMP